MLLPKTNHPIQMLLCGIAGRYNPAVSRSTIAVVSGTESRLACGLIAIREAS